ncbi:toll-like receptor 8, partial [Pelobates cultripes]
MWFPKSLPCDVINDEESATVIVDCSDRRLIKIPPGIPSNVTNLTLTINHIPEILPESFAHLKDLIELDFRCNCVPIMLGPKDRVCTNRLFIKDGSFSSMNNLRSLYLDGNQLLKIPKGLPVNLVLLSLEANTIFSLYKENFTGISNIEMLYLGQNCYYRNPCNVSFHVEKDAFEDLLNLTILSIKSNNLSYVPEGLSSTLRELYLYNNRIEYIHEYDLKNMYNLEILDLSGNCPRCYNSPFPCIPCENGAPINIHPNAFATLKNLRILRLHSNSLRNVSSAWFKNTRNLQILDLSQNFLASEIRCAGFLTLLPKLKELDFSFNFELQSLHTALIGQACLLIQTQVGPFPTKTSNWDICKQGLEIKEDTFSGLLKLKELYIDHNYLCKIPTGIPSSLKILSLQENNIFSISNESFFRLTQLEELYLGNNCYYGNKCNKSFEIQDGAFAGLQQLTVLHLNSNNLTKVPSKLPLSLEVLYLNNNKIQVISRHDFKNLVNLTVLYLSGNCPRCYNAAYPCEPCAGQSSLKIHQHAFKDLINLRELSLCNTSLKSIPSKWFENTTRLQILHLERNYLVEEMKSAEFLLKLPLLEILDLSFNYELQSYPKYVNISNTFSSLTSLKELHLQGYVFQDITSYNLDPITKLHNLNVIDLGVNFITQVEFTLFQKVPNLTVIYLAENKISPFSENVNKSKCLELSSKGGERKLNKFDVTSKLNIEMVQKFLPAGKPQCVSSGKTLDLSLNSIFYIDPENFRSFGDITCLNLSTNDIGQNLNGTEFIYLGNLTYLDLSFNKLDFDSFNAFQEIPKLEVLDLSYNKHYFVVESVTHHLKFIENLHNIKVLNLSWNEISTLTECEIKSRSLKELRFAGNRLDILWKNGDKRYVNIFKHFRNLNILDISHNRLYALTGEVINSMPEKLTELHVNNNRITFIDWKGLMHFKNLKLLDLRYNRITMIMTNVASYAYSLKKLILNSNKISSLPPAFLHQASNLTYLDLSYNNFQSLNKSIFLSGNENYLHVLKLNGNPFDCRCEISDFIMWINENNVTIPRLATDVLCATPNDKKGTGIIYFDLHACSLDSTCMLIFFFTFCLVILSTALPIMKHIFYWDMWYICNWFAAQFKRSKISTSKTLFDAYISYDTKDEAVSDWVFNELCHHLEGNGEEHVLCLEERDWEPGKAVIDNIILSIDTSRKTLFVLTKKYVKSGKFKTAFYLALQKLMDENMDVIIIVLLQPVLQNSQYLRLRRKICKSSILEWPKNPHAEDFFWHRAQSSILEK